MKTSTGILKNTSRYFTHQVNHDVSEISPLVENQNSEALETEQNDQKSSAADWRRNIERIKIYQLQKNFEFPDLKMLEIQSAIQWSQADSKNMKKSKYQKSSYFVLALYLKQVVQPTDLILHVTKQSRLQILEKYEDRWPFLFFRKSLAKIRIIINEFALKIIKHKVFEAICLCVIGANCYFLATFDPTQQYTTKESEITENIFLFLYSTEMLLKIVGLGFILNKNAYLRDPWNCLDFVIVGSAWITMLQTLIGGSSSGSSISALRAFRVLRPLRAVTSIQGLKVLVITILKSIPLLQETFIVLMFFFMIFAVAGLQLFSGLMKQVCVNISTGKVNSVFKGDTYNLGWCGGTNYCEHQDFCGKQIQNADYGSTNYDNIFYAFLNVFISVTLEGWSEFMSKFQRAYTWLVAPFFFIPLSYFGGYFLLNLLLAVINSSFGESSAQQQELAQIKKEKIKAGGSIKFFGEDVDWKNAKDKEANPEIGVYEYSVAKRAAAKMVANFRLIKKNRKSQVSQLKILNVEVQDDLDQNPQVFNEKAIQVKQVVPLLNQVTNDQKIKIKTDGISLDSLNDMSQDRNSQVANFLANLPKEDHKQSLSVLGDNQAIKLVQKFAPSNLRVSTQANLSRFRDSSQIQISNGRWSASKQLTRPRSSDKQQIKELPDFYNKLHENQDEISRHSSDTFNNSNYYVDIQVNQSQELRIKGKQAVERQMEQYDSAVKIDISVNDDIPQQANLTKQNNFVNQASSQKSIVMTEIKRRFKKMKSLELQNENQILNEIENATDIGKKTNIKINDSKSKIGESKIKSQISSQKLDVQVKPKQLSEKDNLNDRKGDIDQIIPKAQDALLNHKLLLNPLDIIDKKTQKIEINSGMPYSSTSQNDITEQKIKQNQANEINRQNRFIQPKELPEETKNQQSSQNHPYVKPIFEPHQLKSVYSWIEEEEILFDEDDEEAVQLELQPYDTCTSVGFGDLLTHVPIKFRTRRSDIIVSSTLQITLEPYESSFKQKSLATLKLEEEIEWCNKRQEFRALSIETITHKRNFAHSVNQNKLLEKILLKLKAKALPGVEVDESMHSSEENSIIKEKFGALAKQTLIPDTLLQQPLPPEKINLLKEDEKRLYIIQKKSHDSWSRLVKKMEVQPVDQRFSLEDVRLMAQGKFHDDEKDDLRIYEEISQILKRNKTNYLSRKENFYEYNLEEFEKIRTKGIHQSKKSRQKKTKILYQKDYIPKQIQNELNIQRDLQQYEIDYNQILLKDSNCKRKTPIWSGQDVLSIALNQDLSIWTLRQINAVRVWPKGYYGLIKKLSVYLRIIIKHDFFGQLMVGIVLANTVVMSFNGYGISDNLYEQLQSANLVFNWIFVIEMAVKLLAVGVQKYLSDKMNLLDGIVVCFSIFELILISLNGTGGNLAAVKTIRVLRTLKVLRTVRLLRSLESMQVIIAVLARSASSFAYITMLLFVFLFIFTLLGMQLFGGNLDFPEGRCRQNYDTFIVGFYTAFQVMTGENWNVNIVSTMRDQSQSAFIAPLFHIVWIVIGNYVLLNLFLAILLDSFFQEDSFGVQELEEMQRKQHIKRQALIEKEKIRRLQKLGASMIRTQNVYKTKKEVLTTRQKFEQHIEDIDDLDLLSAKQIFQDEGLIEKQKSEFYVQEMFQSIQCQSSIFFFSKSNPVRIMALRLYNWKVFDNFIMLLIALSSIKLALGTYEKYQPSDSILLVLSKDFDLFLNAAFLFECLIKIITLGFCMDDGSYLRDGWNQLDFFIVVTSVLDMSLSNINLPVLKILRLLRTLRPLRVISHNVSMKLIVSALFESVGAITNIVVVVSIVFLMFAIFGMNLFAGKFYQCWNGPLNTDYYFVDMYSCQAQGYTWQPWPENFDDIGHGMLTLFCEASNEAWPDVLVQSLDLVGYDAGPRIEYQKENGIFFILFMLVGNFFFMNFFTGVLFMKYEQAAQKEKIGFSEDNLAWIAIQKMILQAEVPFEQQHKPRKKQYLRFKTWKIVTSQRFEQFVMLTIVFNVFLMAISYENAPILYTSLLTYANIFVTTVFVLEAILKIYTYRFSYFKLTLNKFDFFVVTASIIDILIQNMSNTSFPDLKTIPQLGRIMRVLRLTRIFKGVRQLEGVDSLVSTVILSIGPVMNVFVLLILVLFIFSILGVFLFSGIDPSYEGMAFYQYKNFSNFHQAFQTMFVVSTGESWNYFMYDSWTWGPYCKDGYNCGSVFAPLYWIAFVTVVQFVMINLFALVVIDQFEHFYMSKNSPLFKFKINFEIFQQHWVELTTKWRGVKMREKQLIHFFKILPPPIGLPPDLDDNSVKKIMLRMGIRSDDGFVYFNELLYRFMRRQYGNFKLNRKMQITELITQFKLYSMTKVIQNKQTAAKDPDQFFNSMLGSGKSVNLFLQMMYFKISFNVWRNYAAKVKKQQNHEFVMDKKQKKMQAMGRNFTPHAFQEEPRKVQYVTFEQEQIIYLTSSEEEQNEVESKLQTSKAARDIQKAKNTVKQNAILAPTQRRSKGNQNEIPVAEPLENSMQRLLPDDLDQVINK